MKRKTISLSLFILALILFLGPPLYFAVDSATTAYYKVSISTIVLMLIGYLVMQRFWLGSWIEKTNTKIAVWEADLEKAKAKEPRDEAEIKACKKPLRKREFMLLGLKIPTPALIIYGLMTMIGAAQSAMNNFLGMLMICCLFWIGGVVALFIQIAIKWGGE